MKLSAFSHSPKSDHQCPINNVQCRHDYSSDHLNSMSESQDFNNLPSIMIKTASTVWSGIESLADIVADLVGVTSPLYEIYLDDAMAYQESLELQPMLVIFIL